jgi:hypothetical protein
VPDAWALTGADRGTIEGSGEAALCTSWIAPCMFQEPPVLRAADSSAIAAWLPTRSRRTLATFAVKNRSTERREVINALALITVGSSRLFIRSHLRVESRNDQRTGAVDPLIASAGGLC